MVIGWLIKKPRRTATISERLCDQVLKENQLIHFSNKKKKQKVNDFFAIKKNVLIHSSAKNSKH